MDGGSVVAQQAAAPTPTMSATAQQQQQQQQPGQGQAQQQGQGSQTGGSAQENGPNATRVALEFVRQYYTILHESPLHLHRFYNDESDFIHGSLDSSCGPGAVTGVRGQQEIHRTILALNFHDCYAKIAYVDAQESANKSVVVQVAGELSNRGSPMRRFLQTFVLVPLSARKYYVRNDIFRYQDEIYTEDTADEDELNANEATASPTSGQHHHVSGLTNGGSDHGQHGHPSPMNGAPETSISSTVNAPSEKPIYHSSQSSPDQALRKDDSRDDSMGSNNNNSQWDSTSSQGQQQVPQVKQQTATAGQSSQSSVTGSGTGNLTEASTAAAAGTATVLSDTAPAVGPAPAPSASTAPRSWSQMLQIKPAADPTPVVTTQHQQPSFGPPASNFSSNQQSNTFGGATVQSSAVSGGMSQRPQQHRPGGSGGPRTNGMGGGAPIKKDACSASSRDDSAPTPTSALPASSGDAKSIYNVPDNQQLFVGSIPTTATEQDLQDLFKQFGNVIGFRLQNSKNSSSSALTGGKTSVPNFGFVLFDSPEPVRSMLREGPTTVELILPGKPPARLNVEEKKARVGAKGARGSGGVPRSGRLQMTNGGGSGGRREYSAGGDRRPPRSGMGNRGQTGMHDGQSGPTQH
ncbi:ras GTPase-activating protein-binding protein 1-like [Tropilaelaps mercedesae]|uniref:Ras GTPase-activating protein-binding protein 1-like n=1 Tax=Tropilaelaps mercedesae TaxID=418985 RepID=A0A1V9XVQ0_9ACAR|nr:ras GTPase-activating protein-binding protein 1-like [Tropilaelaps mercedesae]